MAVVNSPAFQINIVAPATGLPAWYTAATSGRWVAVPGSTFSASSAFTAAAAAGLSAYGFGNARYVIEAWNSGVMNTVGVFHSGSFVPGAFLVVWGGGHGDYAGNEVYAFGPLQSATPTWRMLYNPTIPPPSNVARGANNFPVSRHTYDALAYIASTNKMLSAGAGSVYQLGGANNWTDIYDFNVNPVSGAPWTPLSDVSTGGAYSTRQQAVCVDPVAGKVFMFARATSLNVFDVATQTWSVRAGALSSLDWGNATAAMDPGSKVAVLYNGSDGGVARYWAVDLRSWQTSLPIYTIAASGAPSGLASIDFDPRTNKFVAWVEGRTLHYLTPPANPFQASGWAWSTVAPSAGDDPSVPHSQGTFRRFGVMPTALPGYYVMPRYDQPVYIYKP